MAKKKNAAESKPKSVISKKKAASKTKAAKSEPKTSKKKSTAPRKKVAKAAKPQKPAKTNSKRKLEPTRKNSTKKTPKIATKKNRAIKPVVVAEGKAQRRRASKKAAAAPSTTHAVARETLAGGVVAPPELTGLETATANWLGGVIDFISKAAETGTITPDSGGADIDFAKSDVVPESRFSKLRVGIRVEFQLKNKFRANKVKTEEKEQTDSADRFSGKVSFISKAAETGTIAPDKGGPDVDFTKQDVVPQKAFNDLKVEDPVSYELKTHTRAVNVKPG